MVDAFAIGSEFVQYGPDMILIKAAGFYFNDMYHKKKGPLGGPII